VSQRDSLDPCPDPSREARTSRRGSSNLWRVGGALCSSALSSDHRLVGDQGGVATGQFEPCPIASPPPLSTGSPPGRRPGRRGSRRVRAALCPEHGLRNCGDVSSIAMTPVGQPDRGMLDGFPETLIGPGRLATASRHPRSSPARRSGARSAPNRRRPARTCPSQGDGTMTDSDSFT
jgi:hypothetical protein